MKIKSLLVYTLLFAGFSIKLFASDSVPSIVITDTGNCYIDGANAGQPADVIANNPKAAPTIQKALMAYVQKVASDSAAAIKSAQDAATKSIADLAKAKDDASVAALAAKDKEIADIKTKLAALEKQAAEVNTPATTK